MSNVPTLIVVNKGRNGNIRVGVVGAWVETGKRQVDKRQVDKRQVDKRQDKDTRHKKNINRSAVEGIYFFCTRI